VSSVNNRQVRLLAPFLEGDKPTHRNKKGELEWHMHCPMHEDRTRSASLNVDTGMWFCFKGCGGGRVTELIRNKALWHDPPTAPYNGGGSKPGRRGSSAKEPDTITEGKIGGWHSALLANKEKLEEIMSLRGLTVDTLRDFEIGYNVDERVYTIPVRGPEGETWNVRKYNPHPPAGRRKIWGVTGLNDPRIYPYSVINEDPEVIIICEGEWDALITIQNGFMAVTRTASASTWRGEWNELFLNRTVYICHDMDDEGQRANRRVAGALAPIADVRIMHLPYPVKKKHGDDLTDFWKEHDRAKFEDLMRGAEPFGKRKVKKDPKTISVMESFDAKNVGDPVNLVVTIQGRKEPGYTLPKKIKLQCTQDAGAKCNVCPMNAAQGEADLEIDPDDPTILSLLDSPDSKLLEEFRKAFGAVKCTRLKYEVEEHQAVEILFGRPSVDDSDGTQAGDYKNIRITRVGGHDTMPNNTVRITGALYANPRSQNNEFLGWDMQQMETSVDRFEVTGANIKLMKRFQPRQGQRPLEKLAHISTQLSEHVTRIWGRPEMHALMDLTFHSVLSFKFAGQVVSRGWLESLIVGDSGTGKSEAAKWLVRHYGVGELINCEAATFAGIIGGAQQIGGKEWVITWGVVPLNDRRLVVLDEISGITPEEISKMSDVRSSGVARITMIAQEATHARTRLLWMGNPRNAKMSHYTYGVDSLKPLIGNPEDIRRYDLAMALTEGDVPSEIINAPTKPQGDLKYTSEACHSLLLWAWTRKPEQVMWTPGSERKVFDLAKELGANYTEEPPLVQASNVRIKIARVAVALAARLFSTDATGEKIVVKKEHVEDAAAFMEGLYEMEAFGYRERSREYITERQQARRKKRQVKKYLQDQPNLAKFLRGSSTFKRQDLEEILNVSRDMANAIINTLYEASMVRKEQGMVVVQPTLHEVLREAR